MQSFSPEQTQNPSPMGNFAPQVSSPEPLTTPQSVSQMMPQGQEATIPQPMSQETPLSNPGGISLQELIQLGLNAYMSKLLQSQPQGGLNGQTQQQG